MKKIVPAVLATLMLTPGLLMADEPVGQSEVVTMMDEVVVTATKTEEKRSDIVNSVIVIDSADIEEAPAESLGVLIANEPGVDLRTRGNYGGATEEIRLRGMGAEGTLVAVDGVTLNSPSLGSADVSQIPLNSIERIEVVKGPGSLLYGSGATGGMVNIISKRPKRDGYTAKVEAGYGTESTYHLAAESGGFVAGDFGYYLTVNRKETDGFRDNSDLEHNDISLNLLYDKGEPLTVNFNFGFVDRDYGLPGVQPPAGIAPYTINGITLYNSDAAKLHDRGEDENRHSSLELKGRAASWLDWRVKGDCAVLQSYNLTYGNNPLTWLYDGSRVQTDVTNTSRGIEGNLDFKAMSVLGVLVGSEYRNFDYENEQQNFDAAGTPLAIGRINEEHRVFTQGTFGELSFQPIDQVKLIAGYRYEDHSRFGHEDVARYGLVVKPLQGTSIKLSHGEHFRAPTLNDLFWPDDGYTKGNPDLMPETGWYTDLTAEQSLLNGNVFVSISWFKWDIDDKIDWAPDTTPGSFYWLPSNLSSYRATGWEAGIQVGPIHSLRADFAITLLDAEEERMPGVYRQANYSPDTQFKAALTQYADFGLTSTVVFRYVSSRPQYFTDYNTWLPAELELDSYWTVDLNLEQEVADHWKVGLLATNLLDEEYATYTSDFNDRTKVVNAHSQQPYPGAGRSVFASVSYEF